MSRFLLLMPIWLLTCSPFSTEGTTSYVSPAPSGSDENPGTEDRPLATIQEAIDLAVDGDTVIVAEGVYRENVEFKGKNIVLRSTNPLDPDVVAKTIIHALKARSVVTFSGTEDETCVLTGFTIRNGTTEGNGGGVCGGAAEVRTHATIENNVVTTNWAGGKGGGGLAHCDGSVQNNTIMSNWGDQGGGMHYCNGTVRGNTISGNSAVWGGGLDSCQGTLQNNTIVGNSAFYGGGLSGCDGMVQNSTIVSNSADYEGGGVWWCEGTVVNCVIWGNRAPTGPQLFWSANPTYSCIQGGTGGDKTNISQDPRFVDPDGRDNDPATYEDNNYRLRSDSPCIDMGKNEDWMWKALDRDGNFRIWRGRFSLRVDMGAYEYGSRPLKLVGISRVEGGGASLTWKGRPGDSYIVWWCHDLLLGAWTREAATIPSAGEQTTWTDPDTTSILKFYRIEIE